MEQCRRFCLVLVMRQLSCTEEKKGGRKRVPTRPIITTNTQD